MFLRGLFTSLLVYLIAWKMGALRSWRIMLQPMIIFRIICETLSAVTYITALGMMPIANASAILQSLPLVVTFGAALFFGEPVGWRRWSAILVGLVGVMIIIRPGPEGFTAAALLCVAAVLTTAKPRSRHPEHQPGNSLTDDNRHHRHISLLLRRAAHPAARRLAAGQR